MTAEAVSLPVICICGDPKAQHEMGKGGCKALDCGCDRYEPVEPPQDLDEKVRPDGHDGLDDLLERVREQDAADNAEHQRVHGDCLASQAKLIGKVAEARNDGESTSARLRRVERERDELRIRLTNEHQATLALLDRRNVELRMERDAQVKLRQRKVAAEAELASARTELEQLRATLQNTATAYLGTTTAATQGVISQLTRYLCETCGARYGQPFTDHEHGPLTPVTVTVARQA